MRNGNLYTFKFRCSKTDFVIPFILICKYNVSKSTYIRFHLNQIQTQIETRGWGVCDASQHIYVMLHNFKYTRSCAHHLSNLQNRILKPIISKNR